MTRPMRILNKYVIPEMLKNKELEIDFNNFNKTELIMIIEIARGLILEKGDSNE